MKNKTIAIFGIGTYILSVIASGTDLEGNSTMPTVLIAVSAIATTVFTIIAIIRLWKEAKGVSITLASSAVILLILTIIQGVISPSYGNSIIILLNVALIIHFVAFAWAVVVLYRSKPQEKK